MVQFIALSTILAQGIFVLLMLLFLCRFVFKLKSPFVLKTSEFLAENFLEISFLVAVVATLGSLYMSEIAHFAPCKLCWFQRIFLYPQVFILGTALVTDEKKVKKFVVPLSVVGLLIALYHILLTIFPLMLPCSDEAVSCANQPFTYFGYITIPVMSATAFLLLLVVSLFRITKRKT